MTLDDDDLGPLCEPIAIMPIYADRLESIEPAGGGNWMLVYALKMKDVYGGNSRTVQARIIVPEEMLPEAGAKVRRRSSATGAQGRPDRLAERH